MQKHFLSILVIVLVAISPVLFVTGQYIVASFEHKAAEEKNRVEYNRIQAEIIEERKTPDHYIPSGLKRQDELSNKLISNIYEYEVIQYKWLTWGSSFGFSEK